MGTPYTFSAFRYAGISSFRLCAVVSCVLLLVLPDVLLAVTKETTVATAQSENFVVTAPNQETAAAVLASAERLRTTLATQWLGETIPEGIGPTVIRVVLSEGEDKGLTWVGDRPDRLSHMMWLTTSAERAVGSTLAHEMTHVVLATRFPGQLPAWVDEGIAARSDDARRAAARSESLAWFARTGNWPSLTEVLAADSIAGSDRTRYAVSASLTSFLLTLGDEATLLKFAIDGRQKGWDSALQTHYRTLNIRALEANWRRWVSR